MPNLRGWNGNVKPKRFCVLRSCFGGGRDIFVCLMAILMARRRAAPGTIERKYPHIVELAVGEHGLDVGLGRRIMHFQHLAVLQNSVAVSRLDMSRIVIIAGVFRTRRRRTPSSNSLAALSLGT